VRDRYVIDTSDSSPPRLPSLASAVRSFVRLFVCSYVAGGILACGLTHTAVTPLDVVKCTSRSISFAAATLSNAHRPRRPLSSSSFTAGNMQIDPKNFPGIGAGFSRIASTQGIGGLFKGWFPTLLGYRYVVVVLG